MSDQFLAVKKISDLFTKDPRFSLNPLNAELNPICHLQALLGGATIVVVSRLRVKDDRFSTGLNYELIFLYPDQQMHNIHIYIHILTIFYI